MARTYNFLKTVFHELKQENSRHPIFVFAVLILVCIPMIYGANSVALGLLAFATLVTFKKHNARIDRNLILPLLLYGLMVLSIFWTIDMEETVSSISKELPLLIIPLCFMLFPAFSMAQRQKIIRFYSIGMTLFCCFYLLRAVVRYALTQDTAVFFYHQLVTQDTNAIHSSIYMSVAFFYFFTKSGKTLFEKIAAALLFVIVFLLSSKNVIGVFIMLIAVYLLFFGNITRKIKIISLAAFAVFICSLAFVPKINKRFMLEFSTVTTDNTINQDITGRVRNISVRQAWNDDRFSPNDFFPGTAFRVYQFRVFLEIMQEDKAWLLGYGLNASYPRIEEKTKSYNLYLGEDGNSGYQKKNFHNQYVQNFAELGVFGFLLLVAMVFVNLKNALKAKDFVHISFAILMISLFLTESFLWRQRGVTFFTMMYCLLNAGMAIEKNKKI